MQDNRFEKNSRKNIKMEKKRKRFEEGEEALKTSISSQNKQMR